jgi:hypothetical protein
MHATASPGSTQSDRARRHPIHRRSFLNPYRIHIGAPAHTSYIHYRYPLMCIYWVGSFHPYDLAASLNPSGSDNLGSCSDRPFPRRMDIVSKKWDAISTRKKS